MSCFGSQGKYSKSAVHKCGLFIYPLLPQPFQTKWKKNVMMQSLQGDATVQGEQGPECRGNQVGLTSQLRHLAPSPVQKSRHHFTALSVMP